MAFPDTIGKAYQWAGQTEITLDGIIYVGVTNFTLEQATEREAIFGTQGFPRKQTTGRLSGLGEGSVEWDDLDDYHAFIGRLADKGPYREVPFTASGVFVADGYPTQIRTAYGCMLTSEPMGNEAGLGGEMSFTFMYFTINGQPPHRGLPSPVR